MNTKFNKWFEQAAIDPLHRRIAIAELTKQRTILFCCSIAITVCDLTICFIPPRDPNTLLLLALGVTLSWFAFFRADSNYRVLKLIEQFYDKSDAKPTA